MHTKIVPAVALSQSLTPWKLGNSRSIILIILKVFEAIFTDIIVCLYKVGEISREGLVSQVFTGEH